MDYLSKIQVSPTTQTIKSGSRLKIAASCFSIYAFEALKKELEDIEFLEFVFTSLTFVPNEVADKIKNERCEFQTIVHNGLITLPGNQRAKVCRK
ncbi:MAG: hypothetical protein ACXWT3_07590 [Methylococcaceae bacterium]